MQNQYIPLSSKPRFEILDGLRGVAAIIVVMFHLFETYSPGPREQSLNHGYFIASIAIAYASVKVYDIPVRHWLTGKFLRK